MSDISRREFIKLLKGAAAVLGVGAIAGPVIGYFFPAKLEEMPSEPVAVCADAELPVNEARVIPFGRYPAIVVRLPDGLRAYSAVCTHFGCIVKWNPEAARLDCPCHEGYFRAEDGSVISGPPPVGLTPLIAEVVDGVIYVKVEGVA